MFKKIILALLIVSSGLFAAEVNWAKNYDSAVAKAKKEHKPILFIISRDTCRYCIKLDNTTLKDKEVVKKLNSDFVAVRAWLNEGDFVPDFLIRNTPGLPGIWFLYSDGEPMYRPLLGYLKASEFSQALNVVVEEYKKDTKVKK